MSIYNPGQPYLCHKHRELIVVTLFVLDPCLCVHLYTDMFVLLWPVDRFERSGTRPRLLEGCN